MYLTMLLGEILFKKESLGGGDVKLLFLFGLVLEPFGGVLTIFLGSIIALPISLIVLIKNKTNMIPFGPFLLLAFFIIYFLHFTPADFINLLT
jgi:prepilin signal peptidase PulO-like enzyme (type II secretory pathway)